MTVLETVALAAGDPEALELHLTRLELRMGETLNDDQLTAVMDEYAATLARIEETRDDRVPLPGADILAGLRVPEADWAKPVGQLSGGEKKIVALAGLLAAQPDVLLLDEPDNHLDLEAKAWLERLLARAEGAVATITHDRYFVDRISNRIFELAHGKITVYHGNYSYYRTERQSRHERAHRAAGSPGARVQEIEGKRRATDAVGAPKSRNSRPGQRTCAASWKRSGQSSKKPKSRTSIDVRRTSHSRPNEARP